MIVPKRPADDVDFPSRSISHRHPGLDPGSILKSKPVRLQRKRDPGSKLGMTNVWKRPIADVGLMPKPEAGEQSWRIEMLEVIVALLVPEGNEMKLADCFSFLGRCGSALLLGRHA
jgi:hypothetical protein